MPAEKNVLATDRRRFENRFGSFKWDDFGGLITVVNLFYELPKLRQASSYFENAIVG